MAATLGGEDQRVVVADLARGHHGDVGALAVEHLAVVGIALRAGAGALNGAGPPRFVGVGHGHHARAGHALERTVEGVTGNHPGRCGR